MEGKFLSQNNVHPLQNMCGMFIGLKEKARECRTEEIN
jgi:hypothetical protein